LALAEACFDIRVEIGVEAAPFEPGTWNTRPKQTGGTLAVLSYTAGSTAPTADASHHTFDDTL
jgi:hypothetical protein